MAKRLFQRFFGLPEVVFDQALYPLNGSDCGGYGFPLVFRPVAHTFGPRLSISNFQLGGSGWEFLRKKELDGASFGLLGFVDRTI